MITHEMRLHPTPFDMIRKGTKTIEMRLNDEKRQTIKIGDQIKFISRENPEEVIMVTVTGTKLYPTFKDAYAAYPPSEYGAITNEEWERMYEYYSHEDEKKFGVLAIHISLMDKAALTQKLEEKGFPHIYEWHDEPGTDYPAHAHKGEVSMYILQGGLRFWFGEEIIDLKEGDYFEVPVGKEHTAKVGEKGCTFLVGEMIEGDS